MDRVSTAVLGLDGQGSAQLYSDYWQWDQAKIDPPKAVKKESAQPASAAPAKKKLSYLEAREWEQMESRILEAEQERDAINAEMHSPEVVSDGPRLQSCYARLQAADEVIHQLFARWAELESKLQ